MKRIYGEMPPKMPEGCGFRIHFPVLANLNFVTGDHRRLEATGGGARGQSPWTIRVQPAASFGHEGAVPCGMLCQVVLDEDTNVLSGDGYLLNDEWGQRAAYWVSTGAQNKNSVDIADVKARFVEELDSDEYWIDFVKWNLAATTLVATPAFADARAEIMASAIADLDPDVPLVCTFEHFETAFADARAEIMASAIADHASKKVPFEVFYVPEAAVPTKITVDETGRVYGHVALWESCHDGVEGYCLRVPRPTDGYASFNKPGVLTDRGIVQTGPIFAYGGHRTLKGVDGRAAEAAAYGGIENAWCDGRVVEGVHGPWFSGIVRPGVPDETVYAARASRISGHWKGDKLKAIVSVNAEGYDVPGDASDLERDLVAGFAFSWTAEDGVDELVASFPPCLEPNLVPLDGPPDMTIMLGDRPLPSTISISSSSGVTTYSVSTPPATATEAAEEGGDDAHLPTPEALLLSLMLEDDDEDAIA